MNYVSPNHKINARYLRRSASGFTLVEMVVAFALAGGLVTAMLWFEYHTTETQAMLSQRIRKTTSDRMLMNMITSDLQRMVLSPEIGITFQGDAERMTFIAAVIPDGDIWRPTTITENPPVPQQDLRIITWLLGRNEDEETHEEIIVGVAYNEQKILIPIIEEEEEATDESSDDSEEEESPDSSGETISYDNKFAHFEYWDGGAWQPEWTLPSLPIAVRVRFGVEPLPEGDEHENYSFDTQQRIIYIPASLRTLPEGGVLPSIGGGQ